MMLKDEFVSELVQEIVQAIAEGSQRIVVWGIKEGGLDVLSALHSMGLISFVSGIIESSTTAQERSFFGVEVQTPDSLSRMEIDTLVIASDEGKEIILSQFAQLDSRIPRIILGGQANYEFGDPIYQQLKRSCPVKSKAGGYANMLVHLYQSLRYVTMRKLQGDIAEFGVYQGGTTVFMAKVLQHYGHAGRIYGFDTFSGFPQRKSVLDIYQDTKCEFPDFETVRNYCSPYNIELIRGDICETYTRLRDIPLVLSFFDTDNYSSTRIALGLCMAQTVQGGVLAFDHYHSPNWNRTVGERIAIKQTLDENRFFNLHGTGIFVKL